MEKTIALLAAIIVVMAGLNSAALFMNTLGSEEYPAPDVTVNVELGLQPGVQTVTVGDIGGSDETDCYSAEAAEDMAAKGKKWILSLLFSTNTFLVAGDKAYSTDVLGSAKISCALGMNGVTENPEGRTDTILTEKEHDDGNLIIVGGPAVNPIATEFDGYFNIAYDYKQDESFQIFAEDKSLFLDLENYPETDICIVYLGEHNNRNVLIVWGYGWQGTYAGSVFAADPQNWQTYKGFHLFFLRWIDTNGDGLVQAAEITVEDFL